MTETETVYTVKCRDCDYSIDCPSAGSAEHLAGEHIGHWVENKLNYNGYQPNHSHVCVITMQTIVRGI